MIRTLPIWLRNIRPLPASFLLLFAAIGFPVVIALAVLTVVPLVVLVGGLALWVSSTLLLGWAGIEMLAAIERWMEGNTRFQR